MRSGVGLALVAVLASFVTLTAGAKQVAFSLLRAQQITVQRGMTAEVRSLAGMTRLFGAVFDRGTGDLILVGDARPGEAALSIDDIAVMLKACIDGDCAPLVSIDRLPDSETTRRQHIRYEGGITNTSVGKALLDADVVLKKLALGLPDGGVPAASSYFDLVAGQGDPNREALARFWFFVPAGNAAAVGDRAVALQGLVVGVRTEARFGNDTASTNGRDEAGEQFVGALNRDPRSLMARPEFAHLRAIMGLAIISRETRTLAPRSALAWWLESYKPQLVPTDVSYPLLQRTDVVAGKDVKFKLTLSGGVDLRQATQEIRDGSADMFGRVVLAARPAPLALTWDVALDLWPGVHDEASPNLAYAMAPNDVPGTTIASRAVPLETNRPPTDLPPMWEPQVQEVLPSGPFLAHLPPGGVAIRFEEMVRNAVAATEGEHILQQRPADGSLTWPAPR